MVATPSHRATRRRHSLAVLTATTLLAPAGTDAQAPKPSVAYVLDQSSAYNVGCYGPCDCAVQPHPLTGTFRLRFVDANPLYTTYAVDDFSAAFERAGESVPVIGSGEYRIGGEVAYQHRSG